MSEEKEKQKQNLEDEEPVPVEGSKCEIAFENLGEEDEEEEEAFLHDDVSTETFTEHTDGVYSITFSKKMLADGTILFASGGGDDKAVLYHIVSNSEAKVFHLIGHKDTIGSLAFSSDGTLLVTGGLDGICIVWDTTDGHQISQLVGPTDSVEWVSWHPSLPAVLAGDRTGMIWMYSAKIGKCVKVYSSHNGPVTCGGFRSDGSEIWSAGEDKTLRFWAPKSGQATAIMQGGQFHHYPITSGCNNRNGALIATGDLNGIVQLTRWDQAKVVGTLTTSEKSVEAVQFSPDDQFIAVASMGGTATIWSPIDMKMRHALQHPEGVTALVWHPNKPFLITACADYAIRVWDVRNGQMISQMYGHTKFITAIDVHLNGEILFIISASEDRTVKLWQFDEKNPILSES